MTAEYLLIIHFDYVISMLLWCNIYAAIYVYIISLVANAHILKYFVF